MNAIIPIAEIAKALHRRDAVRRAIVVLKAYFDDSGTHDGAAVTSLGGWIGTEQAWTDLEPKWLAVLSTYADRGVKSFHLSEALAQRGQYARVDRPGINYIVTQCAKIAGASAATPMFCAVVNDAWKHVVLDAVFLARFPTPLDLCFEHLVKTIILWGRQYAAGEMVIPMFAIRGDDDVRMAQIGRLYSSQERFKAILGPLAFDYADRVVPLQVADLLAHQINGEIEKIVYEPVDLAKGVTNALNWATVGRHITGNWFDAEGLRQVVKRYRETGAI